MQERNLIEETAPAWLLSCCSPQQVPQQPSLELEQAECRKLAHRLYAVLGEGGEAAPA